MRCSICRGRGKVFKPEGYTQADLIDCSTCTATGIRPEDYVPQGNPRWHKYDYNKSDGMKELKNVEAV